MNTHRPDALGSIVHATGFAVLGILVYLALRRCGPAAGSLAAGSSLLIMVLVSMVVLGPWPRWWTVAPESFATTAGRCSQGRGADRASPRPRQARNRLGCGRSSGASNGFASRSAANADVAATDLLGLSARGAATARRSSESRRGGAGRNGSRSGSSPAWPSGWLAWARPLGHPRLRARSVPIDDRELRRRDRDPARRTELHAIGRSPGARRAGDPGHDRLATAAAAPARRLARLECRRTPGGAGPRAGARAARRFPGGPGGPARPGAALLSSPGALAGGPAPAGAGTGGRRLGRPALGRQAVVSRDAGPDGLAPRQPRHDLAGPCLSPVTWHLCSEDRDASRTTRQIRHGIPRRWRPGARPSASSPRWASSSPACAGRPAGRRPWLRVSRSPSPTVVGRRTTSMRTTWPSCRPIRR